jgi:hypothetical protein
MQPIALVSFMILFLKAALANLYGLGQLAVDILCPTTVYHEMPW